MSDPKRVTLSGKPADGVTQGAPRPIGANGQHSDYWVLSESERAKGFVRPVRDTYVHDKCGVRTTMSLPIAQTYARNPEFYGSTFCYFCGAHFPVAEFKWNDGTVLGS